MLYASLFLGHLGLFWGLYYYMNLSISMCFFLTIVTLVFITILLEYFYPYRKVYQATKKDYFFHIFFVFFERGLIRPLLDLLLINALFPFLSSMIKTSSLSTLWPHNMHWVLQSIIAFLFISLGGYWAHRFMHTIPFLWRIHRLHHLSPKLNWAITYWNHPLHLVIMTLGNSFFPILLGMPVEALFLPFLIGSIATHLNHANIHTKPTWFSFLFPSICEHEIHHSQNIKESCKNYGVGTLFWDHIFRTYQKPMDKNITIGVKNIEFDTSKVIFKRLIKEFKEPFANVK